MRSLGRTQICSVKCVFPSRKNHNCWTHLQLSRLKLCVQQSPVVPSLLGMNKQTTRGLYVFFPFLFWGGGGVSRLRLHWRTGVAPGLFSVQHVEPESEHVGSTGCHEMIHPLIFHYAHLSELCCAGAASFSWREVCFLQPSGGRAWPAFIHDRTGWGWGLQTSQPPPATHLPQPLPLSMAAPCSWLVHSVMYSMCTYTQACPKSGGSVWTMAAIFKYLKSLLLR